MVKNPNWQEADQLAIYKRGRGVELGATEKQLLLAVRAGLETGTSAFQVRRPNPLDQAASYVCGSKCTCFKNSFKYCTFVYWRVYSCNCTCIS